jgi:hypothetical protein
MLGLVLDKSPEKNYCEIYVTIWIRIWEVCMLNVPVKFDDLLSVIEQLPAQQKQIIRQRLDEAWTERFGAALAAIHADMPTDIPEDELEADINAAIDEVRRSKS